MHWKTSITPIEYTQAVQKMESHVDDMIQGKAEEQIWLLEHPPLYTGGTSAKEQDIVGKTDFPIHKVGRGGQYTYHGPGQRIAYVMLDLKKRQSQDIRCYVHQLESWVIATLQACGIESFRREGRVGIWVEHPQKGESKIAAIGVRVRKWVTYHGIALNVHPNLDHYNTIIPCGIKEYGVTSLYDLGYKKQIKEVDAILKRCFDDCFDTCIGGVK